MDLIVRSPFDDHAAGDRITDPELVKAIRADHRAEFVIQIASVEPPAPAEVVPVKPAAEPPAAEQEH